MWATYCSMQHSHDNIFAGCLTFRDFCQIFNATHLFSHPAAAWLPYSRNLLSCAILPSCRPVVLSSWHPGILFAALTHLRGTYSVEGVCEQTTRDVVLTAYCDKYVKRIYENTRCQQPGRKRAIRNNGNAFELFSTAALKRLMPT